MRKQGSLLRHAKVFAARMPAVNNLLDLTEVAEIPNLPRTYVRDKLVKSGGFPAPALSLSQRMRRSEGSAVMAWVEQQKQEQAR